MPPPMLTAETPLLLGSGSPRRRAFLLDLGIPHVVAPPEIDEAALAGEEGREYVERITRAKLAAVLENLSGREDAFGGILVADTTVTVRDQILGKPRDEEESYQMISSLVGSTHQVLSSYALHSFQSDQTLVRVVSTDVVMRPASEVELRGYAASGEGLDKAGAYAIQGRGAALVSSINGSYSSVVGLPLCEVVLDLRALGLLGETW